MVTSTLQRLIAISTLFLVALFVGLNLWGSFLSTELWVFRSWAFTPVWYLVLWSAISIGFCILLWRYQETIAAACDSPTLRWTLLLGLVVVMAGFHYDSFVFGGGNLRIAQIAQVETIQLRQHEFGALAIVAGLFHLFSTLGLKENAAGVWGWRLYAFGCAALATWGIIRFARAVSGKAVNRIIISAISIFAGPFLMFCGYVGVEPIVLPATAWFAFSSYRLAEEYTLPRLAATWGIVLIAGLSAIINVFLVPAAVCITVASALRSPRNWIIGGISGLVAMGGIIGFLYSAASRSMAVSQYLVMPHGKLPLLGYTLTSIPNLLDKALIVLVAAPLIPLLLVLVWQRLDSRADRIFAATIVVAVMAARSAQVALDPTVGIVLDLPRFTAFLAPLAIALAFFLDRTTARRIVSDRFKILVAGLCVLLPLSIGPVFTKINLVEPLARKMAERHDVYYRTTGLAFRDAWFYKRNFDAANAWEQSLTIKSPDFLNMRGCLDLVANDQTREAIVSLYRLTARQPYWAEPRALLATVQLKVGKPEIARPHIDTCLQLDPYEKQHLINLYRYYQVIGRYDSALTIAERTSSCFPTDQDIRTDVMLNAMQFGDVVKADSLADEFLKTDSSTAYPHMIKGRIAENKQLVDSALAEFRRFLRYASPGNPDIAVVGKHVADLTRLKNQP